MTSDFDSLVLKAREVRSALLLAGQGAEFEAKRVISASELTEKIVVFRELVIQGKIMVGPRIAECLKIKNYMQFTESLDAYRDMSERESTDSEEKQRVKNKIVGFIEDFLLSI